MLKDFPKLERFASFEGEKTLLVSTLCAFCAIFVSILHINKLAKNMAYSNECRNVLAICYLVPVWAGLSWLTTIFPEGHIYFLVLMDVYEAFVIYHFFELLKEYLGPGVYNAGRKLRTLPPFRLFHCLWTIQPSETYLFISQVLVWQFCFLKPVLAVLMAVGPSYGATDGLCFIFRPIRLLSLATAMITLLIFYRVCSRHFYKHHVITKFTFIKFVMLFHILLTMFFRSLQEANSLGRSEEIYTQYKYTLTSVVMMFVAFFLPRAYPLQRRSEDVGVIDKLTMEEVRAMDYERKTLEYHERKSIDLERKSLEYEVTKISFDGLGKDWLE